MQRVPPGFNALVNSKAAQVAELVRRHVTPAFRVDEHGEPDFEGSGVLLFVSPRWFFVSAAHVFDGLLEGAHLLIEGREQQALQNPAQVSLKGNRPRVFDLIDLGFVELTEIEADALGAGNFVRVDDTAQSGGERHWFGRHLLLGYQAIAQKKDSAAQIYHVKQTYYSAPELGNEKYAKAGLDRSTHIVLEFNRSRIESQRGRGGKPNFVGMSGGGIWRFNPYVDYSGEGTPDLMGFLAGPAPKNKKSIFGSRVGTLLHMLRDDKSGGK